MEHTEEPEINYQYQAESPTKLDEVACSVWLFDTAVAECQTLQSLNIVFCDDEYLLQINKQYLDHDYYTDIISFPMGTNPIEGDLYISVDRVADNAQSLGIAFLHELHRVIVHGLLHFLGYSDQTDVDKKLMRDKEDHYLQILFEQ